MPTSVRLSAKWDAAKGPSEGMKTSPPVMTVSCSPVVASSSAQSRYDDRARRTYSGEPYEVRMMREVSCEAPRTCPSSNCSNAMVFTPLRARW